MSIPSPELNFSPHSLTDWQEAARQELNGADPFEKLIIKKSGLAVKPFYDSTNAANSNISALSPSQNEYLGPCAWFNMPKVKIKNAIASNEEALHHLNHGADGILFEIENTEADPTVVLKGIELPYCSISFLADDSSTKFLTSFKKNGEQKFDSEKISGSVFWKNSNPANLFSDWKNFQGLGILIKENENTAAQLSAALADAINAGEKNSADAIFLSEIAFWMPIGTDFFLEVTKIKAIKHLWNVIAQAYGNKTLNSVPIHAFSETWIQPAYEPHGNLLKQTTAGLSAVLGGCDALTLAHDPAHPESARIARNVSSMLREESHLARVADPTHGAYYLDSLTQQLITETWQKFQTLMA